MIIALGDKAFRVVLFIFKLFGGVVRKQSLSYNPKTKMFECSDGRGNTYTSKRLMDGLDNDTKWEKKK